MAVLNLPRSLLALFPQVPRHLEIEADTVEALIRELDERWPGMWDRLCEPGPRIREHINVFVDGERVAIDQPLTSTSVVYVIPAVAGAEQDGPARACHRNRGSHRGHRVRRPGLTARRRCQPGDDGVCGPFRAWLGVGLGLGRGAGIAVVRAAEAVGARP